MSWVRIPSPALSSTLPEPDVRLTLSCQKKPHIIGPDGPKPIESVSNMNYLKGSGKAEHNSKARVPQYQRCVVNCKGLFIANLSGSEASGVGSFPRCFASL